MPDERVQETGFEIEGRLYPMPVSFRLGDPVLVTHLTGLTWAGFVEALDDPDRQDDPVVLMGLIAVAVWQGNPRWTRERTERYIEQIDIGAVAVHAPEAEETADPPTVPGAAPASPSQASPETPSGSPESPSDPTPASSGDLGSATGSASAPTT